ncbi:MAG: ABC transporter ATP-binding protein [Patescibacteria group bacterium]
MTDSKKTVLAAKDLRKSFKVGEGQVEVLKGINLTVDEGEFVIIFGPSGCGKSTLLHCLLGLENPTSGEVLVEGKSFYTMSEDERAQYRRHKVGMIYQQPLWIGSYNVRDNIAFPLNLLNMDEEKINEKIHQVLAKVDMERWAGYQPTELSSGQQQKISLSRALILDPMLIVADEPTGNLDTNSGQELLERFLGLIEEQKTIIMVTHDLEYLKYATKIFHIIDGEIVEEYKPKGKLLKQQHIGKKEIGGSTEGTNVRDKEFLKKLDL